MAELRIDEAVLDGLAAKLQSLDLTAEERAALEAVLHRAAEADAEVTGFGVVYEIETTDHGSGDPPRVADMGGKLGRALGFDLPTRRYIGETEKS